MSHFAVLVIGDDAEKQLAPYHEFECTGEDDEYVQNVDKMEEARSNFEVSTDTFYQSPHGDQKSAYSDQFYRDPTPGETKQIGPIAGSGAGNGLSWTSRDWGDGKGYRTKVHFIPDGWKEVELPRKDHKSFARHVEDYYGYKPVDYGDDPDLKDDHKYGWYRLNANGEVTEIIDRTNPNAKWDWYSIGGRWTGWLKLKSGTTGKVGKPGLMTEPAKPGTADVMRKGAIDFDGMRSEKGDEAASDWDKVRSITTETWESWEVVRNRIQPIGAARDFYNDQAALRALRDSGDEDFSWDIDDRLAGPRDEYINFKRNGACTPYAILVDGKWFARGEMGWWGCSSDDMTKDEWNAKVTEMIDALPDDTIITVVDCHI